MARARKPACWRAWFGAPRVWLSGPRVHRGSRRPSFGFLHPSLCASSLRRSYMTTQTCKHTPIRLAFHYTPHSSTKTHEGPHPPCGLSGVTFPPQQVTSFGFFSMQAAFPGSRTAHFCCLCFLCTLSPVFWPPPTRRQGYSFPDATSASCRGRRGSGGLGDRGRTSADLTLREKQGCRVGLTADVCSWFSVERFLRDL